MTCDKCGGSDQVVSTEDGRLCRHCYRGYKAGKSMGRLVVTKAIICGNCGNKILAGGPYRRCHVCGNDLAETGDVLRIGGHDNC